MNVRVFGSIMLLAAVVLVAIGAFMWVTGVPDDGRYHVQADNVFELIAKNRALIERRQASRGPLALGGIALVVGGAGRALPARRRSAKPEEVAYSPPSSFSPIAGPTKPRW